PIVEVMQDWARRKPFGSLRRVLVENYAQDEALPVDHWFWDPSVSGGILVEHAVHFIDVVHGCTRAPAVRVNGTSAAREDGRIDRMSLTAVYGDGLIMSQYHAFSRPGFFESTSMRFVFDLAEVDVEGWIPLGGRARVLVSESTDKDAIQLPGARVIHRVPIRQAADLSRPRGWGGQDIGADRSHVIASSGVNYDVQEQVMVEFALPDDKSTVYAACLQAMMRDVIEAIRNPNLQLRVTLE